MRNTTVFITSLLLIYICRDAFGKEEFPLFNWPLHESASVYETIEGVTQDASQPGLNFKEPLYNNINTLFLDGSSFADIKIGAHDFSERDDYTFTFYFKPSNDPDTDRCLFHYQHTGGGTSIKIVVSKNINLLIFRTFHSGITEMLTFTGTVTSNQWQLFSVSVDNSMGKISVRVFDSIMEERTGEKKQVFETPGVLRIGACFDNVLPMFAGSLTCLSLFEKKLGGADMKDVDKACEDSTYVCHASTPQLTALLNSATCPSLATSTTSPLPPPLYFNTARYVGNRVTLLSFLMTQDLVPDPDLHLYVAMYPEVSLFQCGSRCMMDITCVSFSIEELSDGLGTCRIYDTFITIHISLLRSGYYTKQ